MSIVVQALGASWEELKRVIRISGGWDTSEADWRDLAVAFEEVGAELDAGGKGRAGTSSNPVMPSQFWD